MGYLNRSISAVYDNALVDAVMSFQEDHGLSRTASLVATQLPRSTSARANGWGCHPGMERQRWMNRERGDRHILVNIPDFHARVYDDEHISFTTRVVVGHRQRDRNTPEFSDMMDHMVINPSWYVPRSIAVGEYLPGMIASAGPLPGICS